MTVIKWKPTAYSPVFTDFWNSFYKDFSRPVGHEESSVPAVNIIENAEGYKIELAAPGMAKEDFAVSLEKNNLTISVSKEPGQNQDEKYLRREFSYFNFKRSFQLPENSNKDGISASYENGLLNVFIPKKEEAKEKPVRNIEIK